MDCPYKNNKKRVRDDSEMSSDLPESKRVLDEFKCNSPEFEKIGSDFVNRVNSEQSGFESPEAQQIRNEILYILEEPDTVTDNDSEIQDLDSVIKSFQEEILHPSSAMEFMQVSESGEYQPDLGYLLEASDNELGLPPAISQSIGEELVDLLNSNNTAVASEAAASADLVGIEQQVPSYDSLELELGTENDGSSEGSNNGGLVFFGGLFQWDELSDFSDSL